MAMISGRHDRDCRVDLTPAVSLFRSLGDPTRLAIVHELAKGERRVVDLTRHLGLAQSTVSAHLALMRESGIVQRRALGRQSIHRLSRPELFTMLAAAESLLAASGNDVELCPPSDASWVNDCSADVSSSDASWVNDCSADVSSSDASWVNDCSADVSSSDVSSGDAQLVRDIPSRQGQAASVGSSRGEALVDGTGDDSTVTDSIASASVGSASIGSTRDSASPAGVAEVVAA